MKHKTKSRASSKRKPAIYTIVFVYPAIETSPAYRQYVYVYGESEEEALAYAAEHIGADVRLKRKRGLTGVRMPVAAYVLALDPSRLLLMVHAGTQVLGEKFYRLEVQKQQLEAWHTHDYLWEE